MKTRDVLLKLLQLLRLNERVCCLLVRDSVTSTPQWIRQPKPRVCVFGVCKAAAAASAAKKERLRAEVEEARREREQEVEERRKNEKENEERLRRELEQEIMKARVAAADATLGLSACHLLPPICYPRSCCLSFAASLSATLGLAACHLLPPYLPACLPAACCLAPHLKVLPSSTLLSLWPRTWRNELADKVCVKCVCG
jgi:hypothetical protein